jgi:hypothetical protein
LASLAILTNLDIFPYLATILPTLTLDEALETTKIHSIVGLLQPGQALVTQRPFRSPQHTASDAGLLGGNIDPTPGSHTLLKLTCIIRNTSAFLIFNAQPDEARAF